jgi:predicted phage terminase large subunit-like protein
MLQHELPGILAVNPEGGKSARAAAISPLIEAGNVYLPHPLFALWVAAFIEECAGFPNAANDDQVDVMTQILLRWNTVPFNEVVYYWQPEEISPY